MTESTAQPVQRVYDADHAMPPVRPYLAETLTHLMFAYEKSRLDLKAAHKDTWFGRLWNVLNPLLLGLVYWLLVDVIFNSGGANGWQTLAQILGGLFLFGLPAGALSLGARSIISGGTFVLNTRLPRLLLPIGSTISAFLNFYPSLFVYVFMHWVADFPVGWHLLWMAPIIGILTVTSLGLATMFATLNVYFKDIASFLPYVTRLWMYLTPVIYHYSWFPEKRRHLLELFNPLGALFIAVQKVLIDGHAPGARLLLLSSAWAIGLLVTGTYLFLRRERDFAIRI